jgi:hypothetical protein
VVSFEFDSKTNDKSEVQSEKHPLPRISTEAGRQIDCNDEHEESAFDSILLSFEFDSNINDESDVH